MLISTVILSFNSSGHIDRCLQTLLEALAPFDADNEVFVVDNGSTDGSVDIIKGYAARYPDIVKPILFDRNTGTTFSRNAAMKRAAGDFLLVLDSDAYVTHDALQALVEFLRGNPRTGMAVPRLRYASGNFQLSCDAFPTLKQKFMRFLFLKKMEARATELQAATAPVDVDYAISACWMLRRAAFDDAGLFDEGIFYSPEDVDYCIRVWESGWRITYLPAAGVVHDAQELSRGFRLSRFHFSHLKGLFYLFRKHRYFFSLRGLYRRIGRYA